MPVQYKDLGKGVKDLFEKNYEHGKYSLEVKSKAEGYEFTTKGNQNNLSSAVTSSLECKQKLCKLGTLKSTFKPGSSSVAFDLENASAVKDAKFNFLFNLGLSGCPCPTPEALKVNYKCPNVNLDVESNLGNALKLAAVADIPKLPFNFGFNGSVDLGKMSLDKKELALHVNQGSLDYVCKTTLNNDMNCSILNKISSDLTLGTSITHNSKGTSLALAGAAAGGCGSSNQFRIANNGVLALSHITPTNFYGSKFTVSGEFDAFNLGSGSHKLGWGLKFDL